MPIIMITGKCLALITIRSVDPDLNTRMGTSSPTISTLTVNIGGILDRYCADCVTRSHRNTMSTARASSTRLAISDERVMSTSTSKLTSHKDRRHCAIRASTPRRRRPSVTPSNAFPIISVFHDRCGVWPKSRTGRKGRTRSSRARRTAGS